MKNGRQGGEDEGNPMRNGYEKRFGSFRRRLKGQRPAWKNDMERKIIIVIDI